MKIDCPKCGTEIVIDKLLLHLRHGDEPIDILTFQERLEEAERLIKGLLRMADEAMAVWSFAATHGIGLVDEKTAQEKDKLKEDAKDFLGVKP